MTYSYNLNASQLIDMSLKMMQVVSFPDSAKKDVYGFTLNLLNMMIKMWGAQEIHLWKRKQGALFVQYNKPSYELGSVSGADNCSLVSGYISTTLTNAASSGATSIVLNSITGIVINDNIGIQLDSLSRQWTSVTSITPSSNTIGLNTPLTGSASANNTVVDYTSLINRPLEILRATLLDLTTGTETPLEPLTYDQYFNLPIKTVNSRPVNYYYDRLLNNSLPYTGTLYLYGNPERSSYVVRFSYKDVIQDIVNPTDILDFPQEWLLPIAANLAILLASFGYGKLNEAETTTALATSWLQSIKDSDSDNQPLTISINSSNKLIP